MNRDLVERLVTEAYEHGYAAAAEDEGCVYGTRSAEERAKDVEALKREVLALLKEKIREDAHPHTECEERGCDK